MNRRTIEKFPYGNALINIQLNRLLGKKSDAAIIDVGAYDGTFCCWLAERYRKMTVYAIEPNPQLEVSIRQNIGLYSNIKYVPSVITDQSGLVDFYVEKKDKPSQSNSMAPTKNSKKIQVKAETLSGFCERVKIKQIALLILNCEGGEFDIFSHPPSVEVFRRVKVLSIALHGKSFRFLSEEFAAKKKRINKLLLRMGFRVIYGKDLNELKRLPVGHVNQLWIRE